MKNKKSRTVFILLILLLSANYQAKGQKWSIGTNMLQYVNFLTLNAETSYGIDDDWSIIMNLKYNPFTFNAGGKAENQIQNRNLTIALGSEYWLSSLYSGFFCGARLQWTRYNAGGIFTTSATEGDAFGIGFNLGYSLPVKSYFNIKFGAGFWTGGNIYTKYKCPRCGKVIDEGNKWFIALNDIAATLLFTF